MTTDDSAAITRAAIGLYLELHRNPELAGAEPHRVPHPFP